MDDDKNISSADRDPGEFDFFDSSDQIEKVTSPESDINNNISYSWSQREEIEMIPPTGEIDDKENPQRKRKSDSLSEEPSTSLINQSKKKKQGEDIQLDIFGTSGNCVASSLVSVSHISDTQSSTISTQNTNRQSPRNPRFPSNKTMQSFTKGTTLIISPIGSVSDVKNFCNSPVAISRSLAVYPFNQFVPKDVRVNSRRNIVAVELFENQLHLMGSLLQVTTFGKYSVKCSQPPGDLICSGVIGPIDIDVSDEEIMSLVKCYSESSTIHSVKRLNRFNNTNTGTKGKEPSLSVKINFNGQELPTRVYIGSISFKVRRYNLPPLRCFKCQMFGHMANGCTREERCNICSGNHNMRDCTTNIVKCANCGASHSASSRNCPLNKEAVEIEKLRHRRVNFDEARNSRGKNRAKEIMRERGLYNESSSQESSEESQNLINSSQKSYADVVTTNMRTTNIDEEVIKKHIDQAISNMTNKLLSFLQEVLSLNFQKENKRGRKLLLLSLAKHHLGLNIDGSIFGGELEEDGFDSENMETITPAQDQSDKKQVKKSTSSQKSTEKNSSSTHTTTKKKDAPSQIYNTRAGNRKYK